MTLAAWVQLIVGVLKFPEQVMKLIMILKSTPAEKHNDIVSAAEKEAEHFKETGRPTW